MVLLQMIKFNTLFTNIDSFGHFYLKRFANNQNSVSRFLLSGSFNPKPDHFISFYDVFSQFFSLKIAKQVPQKSVFNHKGIKYDGIDVYKFKILSYEKFTMVSRSYLHRRLAFRNVRNSSGYEYRLFNSCLTGYCHCCYSL